MNVAEDTFTMTDFNLVEDVVPSPLVPQGIYHGAVTRVEYNAADQTIDWLFVLSENGGVMSDGETLHLIS